MRMQLNQNNHYINTYMVHNVNDVSLLENGLLRVAIAVR